MAENLKKLADMLDNDVSDTITEEKDPLSIESSISAFFLIPESINYILNRTNGLDTLPYDETKYKEFFNFVKNDISFLINEHNSQIVQVCSPAQSHRWESVDITTLIHLHSTNNNFISNEFKVFANQCKHCNVWKEFFVQGIDCFKVFFPTEKRGKSTIFYNQYHIINKVRYNSTYLTHKDIRTTFENIHIEEDRELKECDIIIDFKTYCNNCSRIVGKKKCIIIRVSYLPETQLKVNHVIFQLIRERLKRLLSSIQLTNLKLIYNTYPSSDFKQKFISSVMTNNDLDPIISLKQTIYYFIQNDEYIKRLVTITSNEDDNKNNFMHLLLSSVNVNPQQLHELTVFMGPEYVYSTEYISTLFHT